MRITKFHYEVVNGCQLRCLGCPNSTLRPRIQYADVEVFKRCLANVNVSHVEVLRLFNFGEAFLHPELPRILKIIKQVQFKLDDVEITTNGQAKNWKLIEQAVKQPALSVIAVSCDGNGTPEDYERLRPPAKWDQLMEFMTKVKAWRDKYNPKLKLYTRTICETAAFRKRWRVLAKEMGYSPIFRNWVTLPQVNNPPFDAKTKVPERICKFVDRKKGNRLYVRYDGECVPCCHHPDAFRLGNLQEMSYRQIITGNKWREMIWKMKNGRKQMAICGICVK